MVVYICQAYSLYSSLPCLFPLCPQISSLSLKCRVLTTGLAGRPLLSYFRVEVRVTIKTHFLDFKAPWNKKLNHFLTEWQCLSLHVSAMKTRPGPSCWIQCLAQIHIPRGSYQEHPDSKRALTWGRKNTVFVLSGQFCPNHPWGAGQIGATEKKKKNSSHRGSWPKTLAPDGISAGSIQQQLSSKKWLRFSGPTLWLVDEMNQEGIEDRWCGQKGKEEKQKRGHDGGHIPNLLLGWKFSSNTTTTGYS